MPNYIPAFKAVSEGILHTRDGTRDGMLDSTGARKDVNNSRREAGFDGELSKLERGQGRDLGRLEHDGISCGQAGRYLPGQHH